MPKKCKVNYNIVVHYKTYDHVKWVIDSTKFDDEALEITMGLISKHGNFYGGVSLIALRANGREELLVKFEGEGDGKENS